MLLDLDGVDGLGLKEHLGRNRCQRERLDQTREKGRQEGQCVSDVRVAADQIFDPGNSGIEWM